MSEEEAFVPQTLREVNFYGDDLAIAIVSNEAFVALRPIVEYLGLAWGSQRNRLLRDDVLTRHCANIKMTGADGRQRQMMCLQLEYLPGWLFGITPSKAKPELLTRKDPSKNHYQSIFGEIYRRFRVSSYKLIRQEQYQSVLTFLDDWLRSAR